jgi:regulator of protease activity HflC (stomatin/prohibitin superfamily)
MINVESLLWVFAIGFVVFVLSSLARVLREYERAVVFRLGRSARAIFNLGGTGNGPGLIFLLPAIDRMVKVSLQTVALDVPPQDVISRDNVSLKVSAVRWRRPRCGACWARSTWTTCSPPATRSTSSCSASSTSTPSRGA